MPDLPKGHFLLVGGPYGSGKSSLGRSALRHEGGGLILLAPGDDERPSYHEFENRPEYVIRSFDDPGFLPALGAAFRTATGFASALQTVAKAAEQEAKRLVENTTRKFPVIVMDTISSMAVLGLNLLLAAEGASAPPTDREGIIEFWTKYRILMEQFIRPIRALRGLGAHIILNTHVGERVHKDGGGLAAAVNSTGVTDTDKTVLTPMISGAFRDILLGYPDVILHTRIRGGGRVVGDRNDPSNPRFVVQWQSSSRRLSKSRIGELMLPDAEGKYAPLVNEWPVIKAAMDAALARRTAAV